MNKKATILHLVNDFSGAARYSLELRAALSNVDDFTFVYVYVSQKSTQELVIEEDNSCYVAYFPVFQFVTSNDRITFLSFIVSILSLYINFDEHIVIHDNGNNLLEGNSLKIEGYRFLHTLHFLNVNGSLSSRGILDRFNALICVTEYGKECIKEHYQGAVHLIYNGVREEQAFRDPLATRKKYGFGSDELLVLYVGRIDEPKGITFLANLFSRMEMEQLRLVIVGSGAFDLIFDKIEANHSRITFTGKLDTCEVHSLMEACDIGIIPSLSEQCSYVALEMMSHGMAIVATEVKGMGELFKGKEIALTVPVEYVNDVAFMDCKQMEQQITILAKDKKLRKRLGSNARREWAARYTATRMALETLEVYRELTDSF